MLGFGSDTFMHEDEVVIERTNPSGSALLYDCDGNQVFSFPIGWTDTQIRHAIAFANLSYRRGIDIGDMRRLREVKNALKISD